MPVSKVQICNMALAKLGVKRPITSLTENSQEAKQCNLFYDQCVDRVLRDAPWAFATRYEAGQLVAEAGAQAWADQWGYAYRYPTDCLFVRRIATEAGRLVADPPEFAIGNDSAGRLIFTDQQDATIEYTARMEDPTRYDPAFVDALVWKIADAVAMPLSVSDGLRARADQMYRVAISEAKAIAANERRRGADPDFGSIASRV